MSNMFTLAFGVVPQKYVADVWRGVARWGLEQIGDYGAFWCAAGRPSRAVTRLSAPT
jgi:hypothetical protein